MVLPKHPHRLQRAGRYRNQSLTIAFTDDREIPRGSVDIGDFNLDRFPQTQVRRNTSSADNRDRRDDESYGSVAGRQHGPRPWANGTERVSAFFFEQMPVSTQGLTEEESQGKPQYFETAFGHIIAVPFQQIVADLLLGKFVGGHTNNSGRVVRPHQDRCVATSPPNRPVPYPGGTEP